MGIGMRDIKLCFPNILGSSVPVMPNMSLFTPQPI